MSIKDRSEGFLPKSILALVLIVVFGSIKASQFTFGMCCMKATVRSLSGVTRTNVYINNHFGYY